MYAAAEGGHVVRGKFKPVVSNRSTPAAGKALRFQAAHAPSAVTAGSASGPGEGARDSRVASHPLVWPPQCPPWRCAWRDTGRHTAADRTGWSARWRCRGACGGACRRSQSSRSSRPTGARSRLPVAPPPARRGEGENRAINDETSTWQKGRVVGGSGGSSSLTS